jgi:hypothetical protein
MVDVHALIEFFRAEANRFDSESSSKRAESQELRNKADQIEKESINLKLQADDADKTVRTLKQYLALAKELGFGSADQPSNSTQSEEVEAQANNTSVEPSSETLTGETIKSMSPEQLRSRRFSDTDVAALGYTALKKVYQAKTGKTGERNAEVYRREILKYESMH